MLPDFSCGLSYLGIDSSLICQDPQDVLALFLLGSPLLDAWHELCDGLAGSVSFLLNPSVTSVFPISQCTSSIITVAYLGFSCILKEEEEASNNALF